jgi:hypothetical protein
MAQYYKPPPPMKVVIQSSSLFFTLLSILLNVPITRVKRDGLNEEHKAPESLKAAD